MAWLDRFSIRKIKKLVVEEITILWTAVTQVLEYI